MESVDSSRIANFFLFFLFVYSETALPDGNGCFRCLPEKSSLVNVQFSQTIELAICFLCSGYDRLSAYSEPVVFCST